MFTKFCVLCFVLIPTTAYYFIGTRSANSLYFTTYLPSSYHTSTYRTSTSTQRTSTSTQLTSTPTQHTSTYHTSTNSDSTNKDKEIKSYFKSYDAFAFELYPLYNKDVQNKIELYHNVFRSQVLPTASNMLYMRWNQEAARQAQKYAEVCRFVEHNSWKDRFMKDYGVCGQNLFGSQVRLDWYTAIESWFSEHENFTYGSNNNIFSEIGHYTSIVWATSHQVGCGVAFCKGGPWGQFYNYVCHYCPSGNYDYYPYKIGTPCDDCPNNCVWGTLCTNSCPSLDTLGNCEELLVEPDICYTGDCNATCWCQDKIHKNYPWV